MKQKWNLKVFVLESVPFVAKLEALMDKEKLSRIRAEAGRKGGSVKSAKKMEALKQNRKRNCVGMPKRLMEKEMERKAKLLEAAKLGGKTMSPKRLEALEKARQTGGRPGSGRVDMAPHEAFRVFLKRKGRMEMVAGASISATTGGFYIEYEGRRWYCVGKDAKGWPSVGAYPVQYLAKADWGELTDRAPTVRQTRLHEAYQGPTTQPEKMEALKNLEVSPLYYPAEQPKRETAKPEAEVSPVPLQKMEEPWTHKMWVDYAKNVIGWSAEDEFRKQDFEDDTETEDFFGVVHRKIQAAFDQKTADALWYWQFPDEDNQTITPSRECWKILADCRFAQMRGGREVDAD